MVGQWTCISSVDTFLYPYALPLLINPLYFLKSLPKCNLSSSLRSLQGGRPDSSQLGLNNNRFAMLSRVVDNIFCCNLNNGNMLREVTVKIGLERIDIQEEVTVEALLDSRATRVVISSE